MFSMFLPEKDPHLDALELLNALVWWITTARYLISELRFCAGSRPALGES